MLASGPPLVLPTVVIGLFLLWQRQLRLLWDRRYSTRDRTKGGALWYVLVSRDSGEFARGFFLHNLGRFLELVENHRGPVWYHFAVRPQVSLRVDLPSSNACFTARSPPALTEMHPASAATRFVVCWMAVYLIFSFSATKPPNYACLRTPRRPC